MGVVTIDVMVEPDVLRDEIGGGMSTGGGNDGSGGDGERVGCTGGGSISVTGISETSPASPRSKGDRAEGGDNGPIRTLFRRGELVRNGETLRSGVAEEVALAGVEDVWVWHERNGDDWSVGRASRNGIRLNVDVFRARGGDFCVGSMDLEDELGPGLELGGGAGCRDFSEMGGPWW